MATEEIHETDESLKQSSKNEKSRLLVFYFLLAPLDYHRIVDHRQRLEQFLAI